MRTLPTITDQPEIATRLQAYLNAAQGAYASNTERARAADWRGFASWCADNGHQPMPATPETVAAFIDSLSESKAPATVARFVSTISTAHKAAQVPNPADSEIVRLALKRMRRARGTRQRQVAGLNQPELRAAFRNAGESVKDRRDKALALVMYYALLRRSEAVALEVSDLTIDADGSGSLLVRRSKGDQEGQGHVRYLPPVVVTALQDWLDAAQITDGHLFRSVNRHGQVNGSLSTEAIRGVVKRIAKLAGLEPDKFSGHSFRVGCAQDLVAAGADVAGVMQAGGWKSPQMPARYAENLTVKRGAVAQVAAKHQW